MAAMFVVTTILYKTQSFTLSNGAILGYATMVVAMSMIFFGVKSYRDKQLNGAIRFGRALAVGLAIAGVASIFYAVSWEVVFNGFMPDFMDTYASMCVAKAKADGENEAAIREVIAKTNEMKEWYKNPLLRFGITVSEILPVGVLCSLVFAAILRRKEFLPATS